MDRRRRRPRVRGPGLLPGVLPLDQKAEEERKLSYLCLLLQYS